MTTNDAAERLLWRALIDDYGDEGRSGIMFITDDPTGSQRPIVSGLEYQQARTIEEAHNAALAAERRATVERIRAAVQKDGRISVHQYAVICGHLDAELSSSGKPLDNEAER